MRFSCTSGMHHGFAWVSIFCFIMVVSVDVGQSMQLQVLPQVTARCGENVTLTCNFSSSNQMDVQLIELSLLAENKPKKCKYDHDQVDREFRCESTNKTSHKTLAMVLTNIMPVSEGKYICKVDTNRGLKSNRTYVKVQDCSGSSNSFRNASHATCSFSGFYPRGVVHWIRGPDNVTDAIITKEEMDKNGLYNVQSTIREEENKPNSPYICSLWIPSLNKYLSTQEVKSVSQQGKSSGSKSSGVTVKPQWICIVLEILMLIFRM